MQKPPPRYELDFVFHPEHDADYRHFENSDLHPFQPDPAAGVPRVNVWWLADSALLTYWSGEAALARFTAAGLTAKFLKAGSTDCYIAWRGDLAIVAFRGTEPDEGQDLLTDLKIRLVPSRVGRVHSGFLEALNEIWPALEAELQRLPGRKVWFCGHSLGAALATLAADRFAETRGVCTFGCPLVGDAAFAAGYIARLDGRSLRYVNHRDIVTRVPPSLFRFTHVDAGRLIARDGGTSVDVPSRLDLAARAAAVPRVLRDVSGLWRRRLSSAPSFLLNHMPKAYAIWTWNDYDAHG